MRRRSGRSLGDGRGRSDRGARLVHACREDIPVPDTVAGEQEMIAVPLVVAAKLALYTAMREQGLTKVGLARRLGLSEGAVRKLLNPNHRSHIGQIERALAKVGRRLVAEDAAV